MVIFFAVPFALRGARMAVNRMKNDVKDWLPKNFAETRELDWFREHFLGEQFVVLSWDGCVGTNDDERFKSLVDKFFPELPPSRRDKLATEPDPRNEAEIVDTLERVVDDSPALAVDQPRAPPADESSTAENSVGHAAVTSDFLDEELGLYVRQLRPRSPETPFVGDQLGLWSTGDYHLNWGGEDEKWLRTADEQWVYITPNGDLYHWRDNDSLVASAIRSMRRRATGERSVKGEFIKALGPEDGPWYYEDPRRLTAPLFKSVMTGPAILRQLTLSDQPPGLEIDEARQRLTGSLFGTDGELTCLVVTLTEHGKRDLRVTLGRGMLGKPRGVLLDMAAAAGINPPPPPTMVPPPISWLVSKSDEKRPTLRMGGPSVDNVAIDEEGQITLVRLVGLSVVLGVTLAWFAFRSMNATIMVFFVGGMSAVISLAIVWWCRSSVDAVLMSMPSLVYVLGLSSAVHIINYYRDEARERGTVGAAERALGIGWRPCLLAALTTSLGLLSLTWSEIVPIRKFGALSAAGVMATLILLFTYLPSALTFWPPVRLVDRKDGSKGGRNEPELPVDAADGIATAIDAFWAKVCQIIIRHNGWVASGCLVLGLLAGAGLWRINTSIQLLKMFDGDAKIIRDYGWLESHLGKLVPMELVVRVTPEAMRQQEIADVENESDPPPATQTELDEHHDDKFRLGFLDRMEISDTINRFLQARFGESGQQIIGPAMMVPTFGPDRRKDNDNWRGAVSHAMLRSRDELLKTDYLRTDADGSELWRISLRLGALEDVDYGAFVGDLEETIEPVVAAYNVREEILRCVDAQRRGEGFRGGKVLLLGYPAGKSRFAATPLPLAAQASQNGAPTTSQDEDAADPSDREDDDLEEDLMSRQSKVFGYTLAGLLRAANLRVSWHDPRYALPNDWRQQLADEECIVLVSSDPRYDQATLDQLKVQIIDARDHHFVRGTQQPTAHQRHEPISVVYTGLVPIVYKAQRTLLENLIESTVGAFLMIAAVMTILLRNVRAGLLSMLPNVFPVVIIFGTMGWLNIAVDIGSMMTASVAMGVAVDDTIHFLTWFRRGMERGLTRHQAIANAYEHVATAMTQTTAIGGLGLSIFALSTFTPTQRFGTMMLALLAMALIGDLIFLPALLASPLGKVFREKKLAGGSGGRPTTSLRPATSGVATNQNVRPTIPHIPHMTQYRNQRDSTSAEP